MSSTSDQPSTDPTEKSGGVIDGTVRSGTGRASKAFTEARTVEVAAIFGVQPYPGTLNLATDLASAMEVLGEPDAWTEHETPIGPLRWWRATLHAANQLRGKAFTGHSHAVLVVRGEQSKAPYLEIVAPVRLRRYGVKDGDWLILTRGWP